MGDQVDLLVVYYGLNRKETLKSTEEGIGMMPELWQSTSFVDVHRS
jgi:hypothetical protein